MAPRILPQDAHALLQRLVEQFPRTFVSDGAAPRPLAIGIGQQLVGMMGNPALVHAALHLYTSRKSYQQALATPGAMRVGLDGAPVEPVSDAHRVWAAENGTTKRVPTPAPVSRRPPPIAPGPLDITLAEGLTPVETTAKINFVLRTVPEVREAKGWVYFVAQNHPRSLPAEITLAPSPITCACPSKRWTKALKQRAELAATGTSPLLVCEAQVGSQQGAMLAVVLGVKVVAGKPASENPAASGVSG